MKLFNFLTRKIEVFKPSKGRTARIYACGPTVYNFAHIGNLRTYIFEDLMRRALELADFSVKLVMNITDVEDKIILEAKKAGRPIGEFVKPYEKAFLSDLKLLNIKPAFKYPRATKHIKEMISLINKLLKKGLAYESDGSIYFDISGFQKYGKLSRLQKRELKTGARVNVDEYSKENARDFVLWKKSKRGEPSWNSPFGKGRPGWHIECSAMSMKYLSEAFENSSFHGERSRTIDIHAGGVDLLFPHHENEIAQSEGASGKKFARFFVEGEHLMVDGKKMSKSLGNLFTLRDLEKRGTRPVRNREGAQRKVSNGIDPIAFRYLVLTAHYRSKLNFSWESLKAAQNTLEKIQSRVLALLSPLIPSLPLNPPLLPLNLIFRRQFQKAVFNDLDTPKALAVFWKYLNKLSLADILWADKVLGLNLGTLKPLNPPVEVKKLVQGREKARLAKNWLLADQLRAKIRKLGWQVEDSPKGPVFKKL